MAVPENIEELAHKVRNAIYGRDVRESLASSMEATADIADWSREVAQQIVNGSFDEGKLNTAIESKLNQLEEDYAPKLTSIENEVEGARGNKSTLGENLNSVNQQLAEKVDKVIIEGDLIKFYAGELLIYSVNISEASNIETVREYINSLVSNGNIEGVTLADGSVEAKHLSSNALRLENQPSDDVDLINPINDKLTYQQDYGLLNKNVGINKGEVEFYIGGDSTTVEYIDNPFPYIDIDKSVRVNYGDNEAMVAPQTNVPYSGNLPTFGFWVRRTDLNSLGTRRLNFRFNTNNNNYASNWINPNDLKKVGYSNKREELTHTIGVRVLAEFMDFVFIEVKFLAIASGHNTETYNTRVYIEGGSNSGKLDIINWTAIESLRHIRPYYVYPENDNEVLPSFKELVDIVKNINNNTGSTTELSDKRGNIIGDSIASPSEGYAMIIENYFKMENRLNRHAIGGRPIANGTANGAGANTFAKVWELNGETIDYNVYAISLISGGTNDFKLNVPLGELKPQGSTFDTDTFYGALQDLVEYILNHNQNINLFLFTPLQRDNDGYDTTSTNTAGHKLVDYVDAMLECGNLYALPTYDAYRNSGVNMVTLDNFTYDGLHLNGKSDTPGSGYKFVGTRYAKFIETNLVIV